MPRQTLPLPPGKKPVAYDEGPSLKFSRWESKAEPITVHAIPDNDDRIHRCNSDCWCNPTINDHGVWIHTPFDGREDYQAGLRKTN
jgi:hypothetical protein